MEWDEKEANQVGDPNHKKEENPATFGWTQFMPTRGSKATMPGSEKKNKQKRNKQAKKKKDNDRLSSFIFIILGKATILTTSFFHQSSNKQSPKNQNLFVTSLPLPTTTAKL